MKVTPIRTHKITPEDRNLLKVLDKYITTIPNRSILVIASKIVALCEGRIVTKDKIDKEELVAQEAQYYIPSQKSRYNVTLSIKNSTLIASAGIDESNAAGDYYILWPQNPQQTANMVREYLVKKFGLQEVGVIVEDSRTTPLRWGTTGIAISHSGFNPFHDYIGTPDLFGHPLKMTKSNLADALAGAAVAVMGEGSEQTPLAVIENVPFIEFQPRNPSQEELRQRQIDIEDDLYAPLLNSAPWRRGVPSGTPRSRVSTGTRQKGKR